MDDEEEISAEGFDEITKRLGSIEKSVERSTSIAIWLATFQIVITATIAIYAISLGRGLASWESAIVGAVGAMIIALVFIAIIATTLRIKPFDYRRK